MTSLRPLLLIGERFHDTAIKARFTGKRHLTLFTMCAQKYTAPLRRVAVAKPADASVLATSLTFPTSKRVAKNRFLKAALTERVSPYDKQNFLGSGMPTDRHFNMYQKYSHGGYGLLLTGNVCIDHVHLEAAGNTYIHYSVDSPERRKAFANLAKACKDTSETLAVLQLSHAGRQTPITICESPVSVSDIQLLATRRGCGFGRPRALTVEDIKTEVIDNFVYAAKYAREAGFDGVQLHSAHGYLLAGFISDTTNNRTDQYGGSAENKARLLVEIHNAVRDAIPAETGFIVGVKINSVEFQKNGLQGQEAVVMCRELEKAGCDFIELSGGTIEKSAFVHLSDSTVAREAFFLEFARLIKPILKETIIYLTGGFRTVPGMVEAVLEGATDGIGLGRPVTAEIDLPKKILSGEVQSAAFNPWDNDYPVSNSASNTQMYQASKTPYTSDETINDGIMDLSDENVAAKYKEALKTYNDRIEEYGRNGIPLQGVFEYDV